jgi:hypothetical protein
MATQAVADPELPLVQPVAARRRLRIARKTPQMSSVEDGTAPFGPVLRAVWLSPGGGRQLLGAKRPIGGA